MTTEKTNQYEQHVMKNDIYSEELEESLVLLVLNCIIIIFYCLLQQWDLVEALGAPNGSKN